MAPGVGSLIRQWRHRCRRSQMGLAHDIGVSPRHLSYVELGKSNPSRQLLLAIAEHLEVPLRERNHWLLAAGYAPRYPETPLSEPQLAQVRTSLRGLLDAHDPLPGIVVDRSWNVQLANRSAARLTAGIPEHVRGVPTNVFRVSLHPDGLAARTANFAQWSAYLLRQLSRATARTRSPVLIALAAEVASWPGIPERDTWNRLSTDHGPDLVVPWRVTVANQQLSLFTTMTTFGTPADITLSELTIELFFPADQATREILHGW
jgi:transcriptional regulator with XRE-family HTH domain